MSGQPPPPRSPGIFNLIAAGSTQYALNLRRLGYNDAAIQERVMARYGVDLRTAEAVMYRANAASQAAGRMARAGRALRAGELEANLRTGGVTDWLYSTTVAYVDGGGTVRFVSVQVQADRSLSPDDVRALAADAALGYLANANTRDPDGYPIYGQPAVLPDGVAVVGVERTRP